MRIRLLSSDLVTSAEPSHTLPEVEPWKIEQDKILNAIRAAMKSKGMTQKAVEVRLDMGRGYVSQLLTGTVEIKLKHILQICELLGTSAREVLFDALDRQEVFNHYQRIAARNAALAGGEALVPSTEVAEQDGSYAMERHAPLSSDERRSLSEMTARDGAPGSSKAETDRYVDLEARVRALEDAKAKRR
jgi:transcriptional regulator with XRE-family HTH domain